jgi:diguanylate cyclase (GGDEF)-like protein
VGLLAGLAVFWLFGGHRLVRAHRTALKRGTLDGLTGLANHRAFQDELSRAAALAGRSGEPLGLIMLDIDGLKVANDRFGHRHGDKRLQDVGLILSDGRAGDRAFRIGGDEFAVLLPWTDAEGAARVANRVRQRLALKQIAASAGAGDLGPGQSAGDLRDEVDAALLEAKRQGGDRSLRFDEIAHRVSVMTAARARAFDALVAESGIDVAFQPIWDLSEGVLLGVEALARPHARYEFTGPAGAFDCAQQLGRVHELDVLCAGRILARAGELPAGASLFLNLSPATLDADADNAGRESWLKVAAEALGFDPSRIVVEVTERAGSSTLLVIQSMRDLQRNGFRIAIDDVGTGNSGLEMLRATKANYIKIDRTVIVEALTDPSARGVLMAMTAFADETGALVVAEGIEDEEVLTFVLDFAGLSGSAAITGGQGYGLGRPGSQPPSGVVPPLLRAGLLQRAVRREAAIA